MERLPEYFGSVGDVCRTTLVDTRCWKVHLIHSDISEMLTCKRRFIVGVSAGIAICLVPPFLSHISRSSPQLSGRSGQVGTLHQMAIVIGLFSAQAAGMFFTGPVSRLILVYLLPSEHGIC